MNRYAQLSAFVTLTLSFSLSATELPEEYVALDANLNGIIDVVEVENAIDGFLEGENEYSALFIHDLIDFFFLQSE